MKYLKKQDISAAFEDEEIFLKLKYELQMK